MRDITLAYLKKLKIKVFPNSPICLESCVPIIFCGDKGVLKDHYSVYAKELSSWGYYVIVL